MNDNFVNEFSSDEEAILEALETESKENINSIQEMARSKMDASEFGVPEQKKFPLTDAKRVKSAIKFFNYVDPQYEEELAMNIRKKAKEFGVEIRVSKKNKLSKYCKPEEINEAAVEAEEKAERIKQLKETYNISDDTYALYEKARSLNTKTDLKNALSEASQIDDIQDRSKNLYVLMMTGMKESFYGNDTLIEYAKMLSPEYLHKLDDSLTIEDDRNFYPLAEVVEVLANKADEGEGKLASTINMLNEFAEQKVDALNSASVAEALKTAASNKDEVYKSKELETIMAHTVGMLCAKLRYIMGQLDLFEQEYQYDGYIKTLFPKYIKKLLPNDLWALHLAIQEHAFTKGRGKKALSDIITISRDRADEKGTYLYNLTIAIRKDLSNIMYDIDKLYKQARFTGGDVDNQLTDQQKKYNESYEFFFGKTPEKDEEFKPLREARIIDDDPFRNDFYMTNIKFSSGNLFLGKKVNLAINCRYREDAELYLPYIEKAFNNVKKSYSQVMTSICNELYDKFKQDHGSKNVDRKQFERAFFKNPLQDPIIGMKDDYGCVFTFIYSINQYIDGRILKVYIKTDINGNAQQYAYKVEKDQFLANGMHSNINN